MDHYMKMASEYLEEFEGWGLYPGWRNPYMWGGVLLGIGWLGAIVSVLMAASTNEPFSYWRLDVVGVAALEVFWLLVLRKVRDMKSAETLRVSAQKYQRTFAAINECRIHALKAKLGVEDSKFFAIAKECKELVEIQRLFRSSSETDVAFYARNVYDPESKARLMAITLAAISFIAALTIRSLPSDLGIFDLFSNQSFYTGMWILMFLTVYVYFVGLGLRIIGHIAVEGIVMWFVKLGVSKGKSYTALRYLIKDLIRFYKLERAIN